jgi:hypothetical protein
LSNMCFLCGQGTKKSLDRIVRASVARLVIRVVCDGKREVVFRLLCRPKVMSLLGPDVEHI